MSPGILAQLWVEEETKRKELEKKLRETLQTNQVWSCRISDDLCELFAVHLRLLILLIGC